MYCNRCGNLVDANSKFCNKCGNRLVDMPYTQNYPNVAVQNPNNNNQVANNKQSVVKILCFCAALFLIVFIVFSVLNSSNEYYFDGEVNNKNVEKNQPTTTGSKKSKYSTVIISDNTYSGVSINNDSDAIALIVQDSVSQKSKCPKEIRSIEDDIINKYGVNAVNLCEMDVGFARELANVFKKVYDEYPNVRGYLTNLTLVNATLSEGYIAAFMPIFEFATADTPTTYPWIIKTQVLLNTSYFLNRDRLENSVKTGSNTGHFPPNATVYSIVAHELGHYLSFIALMKYYNTESILLANSNNILTISEILDDFGANSYSLKMITEAYENYKKENKTTLTLDEWRATISKYALAKNNRGEYIYDETIAESFHDVYLNKDNAAAASKYVVAVLNKKLKG